MRVEDEQKGRPIGDKKYEGYCIDLIAKIEEFLGIRCEFEIVSDGNYGSLNAQTRQWDGLIKQLLELVSKSLLQNMYHSLRRLVIP